jgi:autotransporter-associated beta strand protein
VLFAYNANSAITAQLNLLSPAARMFDRGAATKKLINLARGGTNTLGAVNLNSGELTLYSAYAKYNTGAANTTTPTHFNFNGGLLKAAANNTQLMQGLTAAHVFPGGARIDTAGYDVTINQPLIAPSGYGVSGIALASGGVGYIGAPAVQVTGGSGTGATAIAVVDLDAGSPTCGQVTNILVAGAGSGYGASDALTATLRGGGCLTAATLGSVTKSANASGGLTKLGAGVLTLGGANTYVGATVISNGTLKLANARALPTGTALRLDGGTLDLNGFTVTNTVSGSAGAVVNGTLYTEISPAGTNAVGSQTLAFSVETLAGTYLADVTADGTCDQLVVEGDLDLSNLSLRIVDLSRLNRQKVYHIATVTGELTGDFASTNLTDDRWHVSAGADGRVRMFFADGLILQLR